MTRRTLERLLFIVGGLLVAAGITIMLIGVVIAAFSISLAAGYAVSMAFLGIGCLIAATMIGY